MTVKERKLIAAAIKVEYDSNRRISDEESRGSAMRAVSRLAQRVADRLAYNGPKGFDRAAFVKEMGFDDLEGF